MILAKSADTRAVNMNVACPSACVSRQQATPSVGTGLLGQISDKELAAHIAECHLLAQLARARFRGSKSPADAAEAQEWSECKDAAIKARQQAHIERQATMKQDGIADECHFGGQWAVEMAKG